MFFHIFNTTGLHITLKYETLSLISTSNLSLLIEQVSNNYEINFIKI